MNKIPSKIVKLTHNYTHRIGFLPDLHAGESRAVMPSTFVTEEKQMLLPNKAQEIINMQWRRVHKMFDDLKIQYLFLIGDMFGGVNYRESGRYMSVRLPDQIRMAEQLLVPVCRNRKVLVWRGTQYHEYPFGVGEAHEELVSRLQAQGIDAEFMGAHSYIELVGKKRTRRLFVTHEASTGLVYPATLMSRDINWCLGSEARGNTLQVDAIVRAHLHNWLHVDHSGIHAVQLPCWMGHQPYKNTIRHFFKLQPTIGGSVLLLDDIGRMTFWGGSYPFSLNQEERTQLHLQCIDMKPLNPVKDFGVNRRRLS